MTYMILYNFYQNAFFVLMLFCEIGWVGVPHAGFGPDDAPILESSTLRAIHRCHCQPSDPQLSDMSRDHHAPRASCTMQRDVATVTRLCSSPPSTCPR
uniref:Uncharacterized protein n=1 Tax=Triticum urartu TaxID=4572 RepID=A0A8R7QQE9_TRIUA